MTKPHKCHVIVLRPLPFGPLLRLSPRTFLGHMPSDVSRVHQMRGYFAVHRFFEILYREWFGDVVHRAEHQRLFDALEIVGAGDHDDFRRRTDFARSGEDIKPIEAGAQIDVEEHAIGLQLLKQSQRFAGRRGRENLPVEMLLKVFLQQAAQI